MWGRARAIGVRLTGCLVFTLTGCAPGAPSMVDPRGPGAERIAGLWWLLFWVSVIVFLVVMVLMVVAIARRNRRGPIDRTEPRWGEPFIVVAGVVVPAIVLAAVFLISLRDLSFLTRLGEELPEAMEVVGHDWWWEVRYPNGAVTANEMHIPVGERFSVTVRTADVIHSFWVPQLQAKVDMIPGRDNRIWLEADEPGRYRGQCAEFCGLQHANMAFFVVADQPEEFSAWVEHEASPAAQPAEGTPERAGLDVYLGTTCVGCHSIRGVVEESDFGPDLTHLASRETIAAGILENTRENLAQFIVDPQSIKPGAVMPPTALTSEELEALLDYLESLE